MWYSKALTPICLANTFNLAKLTYFYTGRIWVKHPLPLHLANISLKTLANLIEMDIMRLNRRVSAFTGQSEYHRFLRWAIFSPDWMVSHGLYYP